MKRVLIYAFVIVFTECKSDEVKDLEKFFEYVSPEIDINPSDMNENGFEDLSIIYPEAMTYSGFSSIFYMSKMNKNLSINDFLKSQSVQKGDVNIQDSCTLLIGDKFEGNLCDNYIPIPSIKSQFGLRNFEIGIDSRIFVQSFGYKYSLQRNFQTKQMNLPKQFEHGYSKGFVLTKNRDVLNWIIFW